MNRNTPTQTIIAPFVPDEKLPYIFISYSHADRDRVFQIIKRIYENGWRIWYDEGLELGNEYYGSLKKHIRDCAVFLLFASENALNSHFIFIGPAGTGKTHLAQAFGYECCQRGIKTYFIKMSELRDKFTAARRAARRHLCLMALCALPA